MRPGAFPDPAAERDAFEHMCQYHRDTGVGGCAMLASMYEAKDLPLPNAGRLVELQEYVCLIEASSCKKQARGAR